MRTLVFIKEIFKKFPWLVISNTLVLVVANILGVCSLFAISPLVDFLIDPQLQKAGPLTQKAVGILAGFGLPVTLEVLLTVLLFFVTLASGFLVFARHLIFKTKYAVLRDIIIGTFSDFFNARWYFFSSSQQGTLLNTISRELVVVGNAFSAMGMFFAGVLQLVFFLILPLYISWQVTCISLSVSLLFVIPFVLMDKYSYRWGTENTRTANQLTAVVHEGIGMARVILGFGNQQASIRKLTHEFDAHAGASIKSQTLNVAIPILYRPLSVLMIGIAIFAAQRLQVSVSEMTVLLLALFQLALSVGNLAMYKNSLENFFPSYEQIKELRERASQMKQISGRKKFHGFAKSLTVSHLSFAYPDHPPVLTDINVHIPKGQMVAFVGKSGAGKTTLVDMLMGFHEPADGMIAFDGVPLQDYDIQSYRQRLGYVPQESVLFNMSIRDNLLWAKPDASEADIQRAAQLAYADEFIQQQPKRYDTLVGDRGVRLSGGQIQRIALARALLRDPDILILDEATSSLDTQSERLIQQALENISNEITVIIVAHRLSTIKSADRIYVLSYGRVVEEGTYADLVKHQGPFSSMAQLQDLEISS